MGRKQPAATGALGAAGGREREENEAELGVSFGPNPGAIVHFSTSSLARPPKRIAARAASQRLPRPFGPRQPRGVAKLRNFPETFGRHTDKHFQTRIADTVELLQSGSSKVDDSTTLAGTRQFVEEIVTATAKLDKHFAALVRAASGLPSQATSTAVAVTGAHGGIRASVIRALDAVPLSSDDLAVVDSVGQAEQLLVRRQRAAMRIVAANAKFHTIDVSLAVVLDRRVTGSISEALSDSSSCLQSIAIILSLKGSTAGGRAVDAVDAFTNVPPMTVAASDSFQIRALAAISRAETRVQALLEFNIHDAPGFRNGQGAARVSEAGSRYGYVNIHSVVFGDAGLHRRRARQFRSTESEVAEAPVRQPVACKCSRLLRRSGSGGDVSLRRRH